MSDFSSGKITTFNVLLIDDQPIVAEAVRRLIDGEVPLKYCNDPTKAVQVAVECAPTVILLDLVMPDVDGLTLMKFIRAHPKLSKIPVILLSTREDPEDKARAFESGANDYLIKLPHKVELMARLRYHSQAYVRLTQRDQALNALRESQRQLEENNLMLQNLNRQLEEANLARGQFLARMSHEIRTPINGILGVTQLLKRTSLQPRQLEYANIVATSGELLLALINDILDFSKIEAGKLELEEVDFDLNELLEDVLRLMAVPAHKKKLELFGWVEPGLPTQVRGDPTRVRQILMNLIGNAVKFTGSGNVFVEVTSSRQNDQHIRWSLAVHDTGIGISPENQTRLFQAFSQADVSTTRRFGGSGLGLAIARHLSEQMGGSITLQSREGVGSTFTSEVKLGRASQSLKQPSLGSNLKILVVDESPLARRALFALLANWLAEPACLSAEEALGRAGSAFDAVLIDQELWTAHPWCELFPGSRLIRVVALGESAPEDASLLTKPVKRSELVELLMNSPAAPPQTAPATIEAGGGGVILLVEDNLINQTIALEMIESLGYQVHLAENGLEAVQMSGDKSYDLIIMDCEMPEMDGYQATRAIRQRESGQRHTPIIAMTAYAMQGDREKCLAAGMDDYVTKPFDMERVSEVIARWIQSN